MIKVVAYDEFPAVDSDAVATMRTVSDQVVVVAPSADDLVRELADAEIFYGYHSPEVFRDAPKLRWIQASAAGVDALLDDQLTERGLIITNASGVHAPQVAETAWALTLGIARRLPVYFQQQHEHRWECTTHIDLDGATAGIIGLGGIGRRYANVAAAFGMRVVAVDNQAPRQPDSVNELWDTSQLPQLLECADVVLLSCPYTDDTHHLMNRERFAHMKPTAMLINVARGAIVDEHALVEALREGQLAAAGIDVCETEPLPSTSPLWDTPNLIVTPHTAGLSPARMRRLTEFFCQNLRRYLAKESLLNVVDPSRGYPKPSMR